MDLLGDWWTPLVLREAFYGIRRFDDFQRELSIARNTLPTRYGYVLTEKGRDFFGVLAALSRWGDRWLAGGEGPPIVFHHEPCGHDTHAEVACANCGDPMRAQDTTMRMGPGYPDRLKSRPDVQRRFSPASRP